MVPEMKDGPTTASPVTVNHLQLSIPMPLSFVGDVATNWETFKQKWKFYSEAEKRQACLLLHVIGEEAVKVYNTFTFTDDADKLKGESDFNKVRRVL